MACAGVPHTPPVRRMDCSDVSGKVSAVLCAYGAYTSPCSSDHGVCVQRVGRLRLQLMLQLMRHAITTEGARTKEQGRLTRPESDQRHRHASEAIVCVCRIFAPQCLAHVVSAWDWNPTSVSLRPVDKVDRDSPEEAELCASLNDYRHRSTRPASRPATKARSTFAVCGYSTHVNWSTSFFISAPSFMFLCLLLSSSPPFTLLSFPHSTLLILPIAADLQHTRPPHPLDQVCVQHTRKVSLLDHSSFSQTSTNTFLPHPFRLQLERSQHVNSTPPTLIDSDYASPAIPRLRTLSPPVSAFVLQSCRTLLDASSSSLVPPPFLDTVLARACKQHERRYISQRDPRSACWLRSATCQRVRMSFLPFTPRDAVIRPATSA